MINIKKTLAAIFWILALTFAQYCWASGVKSYDGNDFGTENFEQYVKDAMLNSQTPGLAIGIVQDGKLVYAKGFGVKTLGSEDPITPDTIFQIGSTTKAFTSTLVGMLVDEGKLKWEDKVVDHLPDFKMYDPKVTKEFKVDDIMAQHSGMPEYACDEMSKFGYDRSAIKNAIRYVKPTTKFRTTFSYQNVLFLVAAELIEKYSNQSFEQNIKQRIFLPLEMTNSSIDSNSWAYAEDAASGHIKVEDKIVPIQKDLEINKWVYTYAPAGGINSNINDMAKWLNFQINNGKVNNKQLISEKNLKWTRQPHTTIDSKQSYCLGWLYFEISDWALFNSFA